MRKSFVDKNHSHFGRLIGVPVYMNASLLVSGDTDGVASSIEPKCVIMAIIPLILLAAGIFLFLWLLIAVRAKNKKDKERYP